MTNFLRPIVVQPAPYQQAECCEECNRLKRENEALLEAVKAAAIIIDHIDGGEDTFNSNLIQAALPLWRQRLELVMGGEQ